MMIAIKDKDRKLWSVPFCTRVEGKIVIDYNVKSWLLLKDIKEYRAVIDSKKTICMTRKTGHFYLNYIVCLCLFFSFDAAAEWIELEQYNQWNRSYYYDNPSLIPERCAWKAEGSYANIIATKINRRDYIYGIPWHDYQCAGYRVVETGDSPCPIGQKWDQSFAVCISPPVNNGGGCPNYTTRPVNIATGNKFFKQVDFVGRGVNPLSITRFYNSSTTDNIWTFSYRQSLLISTETIVAKRESGMDTSFDVSNGLITSPSQRQERLSLFDSIYKLVLSDNTIESYDLDGRLVSIQYPDGQIHHINYHADNIMIITRFNETIALYLSDNTAGSVINRVVLPDGSEVNYHYDNVGRNVLTNPEGFNRLLTVTHTDGSAQKYYYEDTRFPSFITGIEDENGHRISSVQYDDQGRAISSEVGPLNSGIERTQIQYHDDGTRTLTNALGKQSTYHFTQFNGEYKMTQVEGHPSANCAGANQAYTYDTNGFMASKTDWQGNVTTYVHNDRGQEISRTEASGTSQARTIITDWHAELNLPVKITEPKKETLMSYDPSGRLLSRNTQPRSEQ